MWGTQTDAPHELQHPCSNPFEGRKWREMVNWDDRLSHCCGRQMTDISFFFTNSYGGHTWLIWQHWWFQLQPVWQIPSELKAQAALIGMETNHLMRNLHNSLYQECVSNFLKVTDQQRKTLGCQQMCWILVGCKTGTTVLTVHTKTNLTGILRVFIAWQSSRVRIWASHTSNQGRDSLLMRETVVVEMMREVWTLFIEYSRHT